MKIWRAALAGLLALAGGIGVANYALAPASSAAVGPTPVAIGPRHFRHDGRARVAPSAGPTSREHSPSSPGADPRTSFAMSGGAGMGVECAGNNVTTPDGGALVVVRSGVAECISSDGQTITQVATDRPRVMTGAVDRTILGVLSEQTASTNYALNSRDLSQAAWVKSNMTCTRTAPGMRGGDVNGASRCCATAANGTAKQTIASLSNQSQAMSWHLKRATGTGAVNLAGDGSTWLADIGASLSSTIWKRAVPTETVGCRAVSGGTSRCIAQQGLWVAPVTPIQSLRIVTSGDCVDVDFVQDEPSQNGAATSPIEVPSVTPVARAAEIVDLTVPTTWPDQFCVAATALRTTDNPLSSSPTIFPRFSGVLGDKAPGEPTGSDSFTQMYVNTSGGNVFVSSNTVLDNTYGAIAITSPYGFDGGSLIRQTHYWNMTSLNLCVDGVCIDGVDNPAEGSAATPNPYTSPTWTRLRLSGYTTSNGAVDAVISEVTADPDAIVCPRYLSISPSGFGAALGDSITAHPAGIEGWTNEANQRWANSGSRLQITPLARGSAFTGTNDGTGNNAITYQWDTFAKNRRYQVLFVLGGINDITSGKNMTTALANLTRIWDEAIAAGMDVHPMTLSPASNRAGWNGTKQTQLETLNAAILAYCAAQGLVCIDLYNSALRDGTALAAAYDSGDGVHPNAAGESLIAQLVVAAHP